MNLPHPALPRSYSVAPAPRPTERTLAATERALQGQDLPDTDAINAFLHTEAARRALASPPPAGTWAQAQELAFDAWEATGPARYDLARQALAAHPHCSDAWLIAAEQEPAWRKQRRCFERAVAAAKQAGQEQGWLTEADGERPDSLYEELPARAYFRAHVALARCLRDGGYPEEAQPLYEHLLGLDPEDHMGVRYEVLPLYHLRDDRPALRRLLDQHAEDTTTFLAYERLWLALAEGEAEPRLQQLAGAAEAANPHVPAFLLGEAEAPDDEHSEYMTLGGEDEAAEYAALAWPWWEQPQALAWLEARSRS